VSIDGGYSFERAEHGTGVLPLSDNINAIATCEHDPDFVVGVGLADDGTDGFILVGND